MQGRCCVAATNLKEPQILYDALCSKDGKLWEDAAKQELISTEQNDTFEVCEFPEGNKAIGSKRVLKTKTGANGKIVKHKARLACQGFHAEGRD